MPDAKSYIGSQNDGGGDPHQGYAPYDFESIMHYPIRGTADTIPSTKQVLWAAEQKLSAGDIRQLNDMYQCKTQTGGTGGLTKPTPASTPACSWKTPTTNDMLQCVDGSTCSGGLAVGPAVRSAQPMHQLCAIRKLVVVGWLKVCLAIGIVALAIAPTMVVSALAEHVFVYMPIIRNI